MVAIHGSAERIQQLTREVILRSDLIPHDRLLERVEVAAVNLALPDELEMMRANFGRLLSEQSSPARVRKALPEGFDRELWKSLAQFGVFSLRVAEDKGGMGLGLLDACVLMEEVGRTLASGPIVEMLVGVRLLGWLGGSERSDLLERALTGDAVVTVALHDVSRRPRQWVAGGAVADCVLACDGTQVFLVSLPRDENRAEPNLASTPIAELDFGKYERIELARGTQAVDAFRQGVEEWKLLMGAALSGLSREAIRLAAEYACQRIAFGQPIGTYQAISHPLADLITDVDGGRLLIWKALQDIADGVEGAGATVSLAAWWNIDVAARAVAHALHTFGGYGLTLDYDIHLYNLRAKAWPLVFGDPRALLAEAGRRLYAGEAAALPDVGELHIDFDIGDEARRLIAEIDRFFEQNMTEELRRKAHFSWDGHDPGFHKQLASAGLLFLDWPKEKGGRGASIYAQGAAINAFERHGWSNPAAQVTSMVGRMIERFGSDELKREVIPRLIAGEALCCLGFSEPGAGSDVFAAQCRATRVGEGWRIDGTKMFTSGANVADYVLLLTRTNPDAPKHRGLTVFIVPLKTPGITIQPVYTFQDERTNITFYDDVRIPDTYRLGEVDGGVKVMSAGLELDHAGGYPQVQRSMLQAAETLCGEIQSEGRPLIEQPHAQERLARAAANVAVAELLFLRLQWSIHEGKSDTAQGSMLNLFSCEKFCSDARDLLDLTAPLSLSKREAPASLLNQCYRHSQAATIYGGSSEIHRSVIAERVLGLPRSRA